MGALWLMIYDKNKSRTNVDIEMTNKFMNLKKRGQDDTAYLIEETLPITAMNAGMARLHLSKSQLASYSPLTLMYGFHRMGVNDLSLDGSQPFVDPILSMVLKYPDLKLRPVRKLMCNGEIYNYKELICENNFGDKDLCSGSDVEVILPMYIKSGLEATLKALDGDFAFVLMDNVATYNLKQMGVYVGRDPFGLRSLYMVKRKGDVFWMFVSELKGIPRKMLMDNSYSIVEIPAGSYWSFGGSRENDEFTKYNEFTSKYSITTADPDVLVGVYSKIRNLVTKSVKSRFSSSDVPVGILLSGGFDSCVIASVLIKELVDDGYNFTENPLMAFTMGELDSEDVMNACACVSYLENKWGIDIHHHIITHKNFDVELDDVARQLVYIMETTDLDRINSAVPMYLMYKYISEATGVKVILSGVGLDELFKIDDSGYDIDTFVGEISSMRLDRISGYFGLEERYPFLNLEFVNFMLGIDPKLKCPQVYSYGKQRIGKYLVRKSFDTGEYLESNVLWRPNDSVGIKSSLTEEEVIKEYKAHFGRDNID